jgi:deoxyribonuclease V
MRAIMTHDWQVTPAQAAGIQAGLAGRVERVDRFGEIRTVAGIDVSVRDDLATAAVVVLALPGLGVVETCTARRPVEFPYVPGLLAFREGPAVLDALERLREDPDLLMFDAHGVAHPRRMGLASHLGVLLDRPSIGCAKSRLCGKAGEPGPEAGAAAPLLDGEEIIGAVVRTRTGASPLYVSTGHRVGLAAAVRLALACCRGHRLPEPTRQAHLAGRVAQL